MIGFIIFFAVIFIIVLAFRKEDTAGRQASRIVLTVVGILIALCLLFFTCVIASLS